MSSLFFSIFSFYSFHDYFIQVFLSRGFPGGSLVRDLPANAGDTSLIPGGGNGNPLQYPRLGNPMDRGAQQATVDEVEKSRA